MSLAEQFFNQGPRFLERRPQPFDLSGPSSLMVDCFDQFGFPSLFLDGGLMALFDHGAALGVKVSSDRDDRVAARRCRSWLLVRKATDRSGVACLIIGGAFRCCHPICA